MTPEFFGVFYAGAANLARFRFLCITDKQTNTMQQNKAVLLLKTEP